MAHAALTAATYDLARLVPADPAFSTHSEAVADLDTLDPSGERVSVLGTSERGRPIVGVKVGTGPRRALLLAGHHADEPVGSETLRLLARSLLADPDAHADLLARWTLYLVPHANPDGEAANRGWIETWPDAADFITRVRRELPGRDLEFAYPDRRQEAQMLSAWMRTHGPFDLYASLHGMAFSEGAMLLIDRMWAGRSQALQLAFGQSAQEEGLDLHDHNRGGEKGFFYIDPGFTTTPEGRAMQRHFEHVGDADMAARFGLSSMEFVQSLGGDPLCLVTELPLFVVASDPDAPPGSARAYVQFKGALGEVRKRLQAGDRSELDRWRLRPLGLASALRIQLATIGAALRFRETAPAS
jgi:hypothetical protein